ncbi:MAG: protein translocase subunit SecD [Chloroflexi bacterium]|nr:protein translocase subunit SecD [Chloroflexota bacterium]
MRNRNTVVLALIFLMALFVLWVDLPIEHPRWAKQLLFWQQPAEYRDLKIKQGLDLQGGTQILLEAKPVPGQKVTAADMEAAKVIVDRRVNALGVTEPLVQLQGENRIIVELPGINNPDQAVQTLRSTGQLEFVEIGSSTTPQYPNVKQGTYLRTTNNEVVPDKATLGKTEHPYPDVVFKTIMTGRDLKTASVVLDRYSAPSISFELSDNGATIFADYTAKHIGDVLAIVLDNVVLSAPRIDSAIPEGKGVIEGKFTRDEADSLAVQMRYGALPVALEIANRRTIGATLGADSVRRSVTAGLIGLAMVLLFMLVYYRLPGALASVALMIYAGLNLALYKLMPVTLTLPGIAGFLLSTGMAVDANILIFERMKEELRWGRTLRAAVDAGFNRAWTSIFDSNLSTLITCLILILFGRTFGAQAVLGFAVNLAIGVLISMFTAVTVTRTFMRAVFDREAAEGLRAKHWLLGI